MSKIEAIVDSLTKNITFLVKDFDNLKHENAKLSEELAKSKQIIQKQTEQISEWEEQFENLKFTNSLLGSDENKRETKLKINTLIRDLDYCIAQLAE